MGGMCLYARGHPLTIEDEDPMLFYICMGCGRWEVCACQWSLTLKPLELAWESLIDPPPTAADDVEVARILPLLPCTEGRSRRQDFSRRRGLLMACA